MTDPDARMGGERIEDVVRNYLVQEILYDKPGADLEPGFNIIDAGILDSIGIMRLVSFLEARFGFRMKPEEMLLEHFETISAIKSFVLTKLT